MIYHTILLTHCWGHYHEGMRKLQNNRSPNLHDYQPTNYEPTKQATNPLTPIEHPTSHVLNFCERAFQGTIWAIPVLGCARPQCVICGNAMRHLMQWSKLRLPHLAYYSLVVCTIPYYTIRQQHRWQNKQQFRYHCLSVDLLRHGFSPKRHSLGFWHNSCDLAVTPMSSVLLMGPLGVPQSSQGGGQSWLVEGWINKWLVSWVLQQVIVTSWVPRDTNEVRVQVQRGCISRLDGWKVNVYNTCHF